MNFLCHIYVIFAQSKVTKIFLQRSMFHFELILVHAVRYGSKIFILFCFDFTREHPVVIAPFVEQTMNCLRSFVNNQLFMYAGIHFWTLHSVPFIYLSILTAIPNCLGYCSFIINLAKKLCLSSDFVLLQSCFGCSRSFEFSYELQKQFVDFYFKKEMQGLGLGRLSIYRSISPTYLEEKILLQTFSFLFRLLLSPRSLSSVSAHGFNFLNIFIKNMEQFMELCVIFAQGLCLFSLNCQNFRIHAATANTWLVFYFTEKTERIERNTKSISLPDSSSIFSSLPDRVSTYK